MFSSNHLLPDPLKREMGREKSKKSLTPLMQQYWDIKKNHSDEILLFRMGDFYEIFAEDALLAAPIVGLTLTARNKKSGDKTPMCGFPHYSVATPVEKLLNAGLKVALCEQMESPSEGKALVKRSVVRRLSPGMVYDPEQLDQTQGFFMMAFDQTHVAVLEASTGQAFIYPRLESLDFFFESLNIVEVIFSREEEFNHFDPKYKVCKSLFRQGKSFEEERGHLGADQVLVKYVCQNQGDNFLKSFSGFKKVDMKDSMNLSSQSIKHLEIFNTYEGDSKGSLFHTINKTVTPLGSRQLKSWLRSPLTSKNQIEARHDQVELWTKESFKLKSLREMLRDVGDLERRSLKLTYSSCSPADLRRLFLSLSGVLNLAKFLDLSSFLKEEIIKAQNLIASSIKEEAPSSLNGGSFIKKGFDAGLDEVTSLSENAHESIRLMEENEKRSTKISSLKIRYNKVFGYYIEVTKVHSQKIPSVYICKQTLTSCERFTTKSLQELEEKVLSATSKRNELETEIFHKIKKQLLDQTPHFLKVAEGISELDVLSSLAWLALEKKYIRPKLNMKKDLFIEQSRHPVVEVLCEKSFVSNDIFMGEGQGLLITGPNMAGKSTLMRQMALCVLLSQIGSFIPATQAHLPIYHSLYTRIGASDFLSQGLSTFMVEMSETSKLLNEANTKSLVIIDEIGRGTSTYDGLSLAQSILEYLLGHHIHFIFSTHYQELTHLEAHFSNLKNKHMSAKKNQGQIIFEYVLSDGPTEKSYGIEVAKLAGLPQSVTQRAESLLQIYENSSMKRTTHPSGQLEFDFKGEDPLSLQSVINPSSQGEVLQKADLSLNAHLEDNSEWQKMKDLVNQIKEFSVNEESPIKALNQIAQWQKSVNT